LRNAFRRTTAIADKGIAMKEIQICDLRKIINMIIDTIEFDDNLKSVVIDDDRDFYYQIDNERSFDVSRELGVDEIEIGRISDDYEFLLSILQDENQALPIMLEHVAPILYFLALRISSVGRKQNV
jgi:hypothetical protein